jgi:hypothetical protein
MTVTTGMLISGKMSVGIDTMADTPSTRMSAASTKNVCGNFSAKRTIPISRLWSNQPAGRPDRRQTKINSWLIVSLDA